VCVKRRTEHAFELRLLVGIHDVIHSAAGGEGVVLKAEEAFWRGPYRCQDRQTLINNLVGFWGFGKQDVT